ncbi:hypothetical protein ES703_88750 [subsurface metagenome]
MITKEWNRAFELTVPIVAAGLEALAASLAIIALRRVTSPLGQRAYYEDGQWMVNVRYPGQWNDIREFVQPDNPDVLAVYSQYGPDYWALYDFVCQNIDYRLDTGEMWLTPSETLRGFGDCEDTSILLASLMGAGGINCYVALGNLGGYGHAWCTLNGQILETTYMSARAVPNPEDYCPYVLFSDRDVIELWPGALGEVFEIRRNEGVKLNLIAEAVLCMSL